MCITVATVRHRLWEHSSCNISHTRVNCICHVWRITIALALFCGYIRISLIAAFQRLNAATIRHGPIFIGSAKVVAADSFVVRYTHSTWPNPCPFAFISGVPLLLVWHRHTHDSVCRLVFQLERAGSWSDLSFLRKGSGTLYRALKCSFMSVVTCSNDWTLSSCWVSSSPRHGHSLHSRMCVLVNLWSYQYFCIGFKIRSFLILGMQCAYPRQCRFDDTFHDDVVPFFGFIRQLHVVTKIVILIQWLRPVLRTLVLR